MPAHKLAIDGDKATCKVCGGMNSSGRNTLTSDCPGSPITADEAEKISTGELNYVGSTWARNFYRDRD